MSNLRKEVKGMILNRIDGYTREDAEFFFEHPLEYSCANGCIPEMVYYSDTESFAIENHDEIIEQMLETDTKPLLLNDMAWFGFEVLVPTLKDEIMEEVYDSEHLCDTCEYCMADCKGTPLFGHGGGNDNVYRCASYKEKGKNGSNKDEQ